jgi:hypothetical protein
MGALDEPFGSVAAGDSFAGCGQSDSGPATLGSSVVVSGAVPIAATGSVTVVVATASAAGSADASGSPRQSRELRTNPRAAAPNKERPAAAGLASLGPASSLSVVAGPLVSTKSPSTSGKVIAGDAAGLSVAAALLPGRRMLGRKAASGVEAVTQGLDADGRPNQTRAFSMG